jgi:hypothetical protein
VIDGRWAEFTRERAAAAEPPGPKPAKPSKAIVPANATPVTLEVLDAMPVPAPKHSLLSEMNADQLGGMIRGLDQARAQYESLSGTCATLAGLVCLEAKKRVGHGAYGEWVKTHLGKSSKTASLYVAVAKAFLKFEPKVKFEQLTLALMDGAATLERESLDLTHPTVNAVAQWTKGRTFYELRQTFAGEKGGERSKPEKLTAEQEREAFENACREDFERGCMAFDQLVSSGKWKLRNEAEIELMIATAERAIEEGRAWLKVPPSKRTRPDVASFFQLEDPAAEPEKPAKAAGKNGKGGK